MRPTVSVIMPNRNHARFLPGAVRALADQSVPPEDILLVDDGSTDDSVEVMRGLAQTHPSVRVLINETNLGTTASCNRGLAEARGTHLLFAAADDLVLPGLIETGLDRLARHPGAPMCCRTYLMYDEGTEAVHELDYLWGSEERYLSPADLAELLPGWSIQTMGTLYDRSAFEAAGGLREELLWHSDWYVSQVLALRHGICYVPEPGTIRREHGDSYSQRGRKDWERQRHVIRAILDLFLSEQRELLPLAARAQLFGFFGDELSRLHSSDLSLWTPEILTLALPALQHPISKYEQRKSLIFRSRKETPQAEFVKQAFEEAQRACCSSRTPPGAV
jgi:glycosyltransferase involved in cell wall biosynthesis